MEHDSQAQSGTPFDGADSRAADELFTMLYRELHSLAERHLSHQGSGFTLGATTLLHEAYLSIANRGDLKFPDRARFLGYASRAMRGLIVDYARRRQAKKRGGEFHITRSEGLDAPDPRSMLTDLDELSEALDELGKIEPELAQLVDLHFFCGLTFGEIAALRGVSERTVQRDWRTARLLLHRTLKEPGATEE
ncbi:MAG TPA: ECF-type sigma factor [Gemmatimonadales bacterium]|nr:ECF-type sigma factor [Gemmatimonadales bacterium]